MTKEWVGRIRPIKILPALGMTLHCRNMTCTASLRHMVYSLTIDIKPLFLAKNEKKSKKNAKETYDGRFKGSLSKHSELSP